MPLHVLFPLLRKWSSHSFSFLPPLSPGLISSHPSSLGGTRILSSEELESFPRCLLVSHDPYLPFLSLCCDLQLAVHLCGYSVSVFSINRKHPKSRGLPVAVISMYLVHFKYWLNKTTIEGIHYSVLLCSCLCFHVDKVKAFIYYLPNFFLLPAFNECKPRIRRISCCQGDWWKQQS